MLGVLSAIEIDPHVKRRSGFRPTRFVTVTWPARLHLPCPPKSGSRESSSPCVPSPQRRQGDPDGSAPRFRRGARFAGATGRALERSRGDRGGRSGNQAPARRSATGSEERSNLVDRPRLPRRGTSRRRNQRRRSSRTIFAASHWALRYCAPPMSYSEPTDPSAPPIAIVRARPQLRVGSRPARPKAVLRRPRRHPERTPEAGRGGFFESPQETQSHVRRAQVSVEEDLRVLGARGPARLAGGPVNEIGRGPSPWLPRGPRRPFRTSPSKTMPDRCRRSCDMAFPATGAPARAVAATPFRSAPFGDQTCSIRSPISIEPRVGDDARLRR